MAQQGSSDLSAGQTGLQPPGGQGCCLKKLGRLSLPPTAGAANWVTVRSQHLGQRPQALQAALENPHSSEKRKRNEKQEREGRRTPHFPGSWGSWGSWGPRRVAAQATAELRTRAQSWASPPAIQGWLARCGRHPCQTGLWGQRRSACRRRTGSRRAPTGPRWRAGGSGAGTRGRCSHGRPGWGQGKALSEMPLQRCEWPCVEKDLRDSECQSRGCSPRAGGRRAGLVLRFTRGPP